MDAAADHALMVKQAPSKAKPVKVARPMNSFMVFAKEHRKLLQAENPDSDNKVRNAAISCFRPATYSDRSDIRCDLPSFVGYLR